MTNEERAELWLRDWPPSDNYEACKAQLVALFGAIQAEERRKYILARGKP
jgi:hypothetical protein